MDVVRVDPHDQLNPGAKAGGNRKIRGFDADGQQHQRQLGIRGVHRIGQHGGLIGGLRGCGLSLNPFDNLDLGDDLRPQACDGGGRQFARSVFELQFELVEPGLRNRKLCLQGAHG